MHTQPAQNRLRELRDAKGVTRRDIASACGGVYESTVRRWEEKYIPPQYLAIVAGLFGVSVDYLIGLDEDEPQEQAA